MRDSLRPKSVKKVQAESDPDDDEEREVHLYP